MYVTDYLFRTAIIQHPTHMSELDVTLVCVTSIESQSHIA